MALQVKGGPDGVTVFEMDPYMARALAKRLVTESVSFYFEPWVDGLHHFTVNGAAAGHVENHLLSIGLAYHRIPKFKSSTG